jgi:hypothetical protein
MKYYPTPVKMAIVKNETKLITNAVRDMERGDLSYTVRGNVNYYSHY